MPADRKGFSMQLDAELLERIDHNAQIHADGNRTQYILSWLPETYEQPNTASKNSTNEQRNNSR